MEPSKSTLKKIRLLHQKKFREETGLFVAEGKKVVEEAMRSALEVKVVYTTDPGFHPERKDVFLIPERDMEAISAHTTPSGYLVVMEIPDQEIPDELPDVVIALDGIRDPGNMGTLLRTCDWFGFRMVLCSDDCVDIYNPKVVQAAMGSLFRTVVLTGSFLDTINGLRERGYAVLGADLRGSSLHTLEIPEKYVLIIGSESHGIRPDTSEMVTQRISIPGESGAESLNAAVAAGIILSSLHQRRALL